ADHEHRLGRRQRALRAGMLAALDLERRRRVRAEQAAHELAREALGALRRRRGAFGRRRDAHAMPLRSNPTPSSSIAFFVFSRPTTLACFDAISTTSVPTLSSVSLSSGATATRGLASATDDKTSKATMLSQRTRRG